jgi:hypothetical protein
VLTLLAAYAQWFDQQAQRRDGRRARATSAMLVVGFLDHPYDDWSGSIQPEQMRVTLQLIDDGHDAPCDANGMPT